MNSFIFTFAAVLAVAHGGLLAPLARTTILEGPSSSAQVVGNDGSVIIGGAPGGRIIANENLGGAAVAYSAPALVAHAAPLLAPASLLQSSVVAHASPLLLPGSRSIVSIPRGHGIEGAWIPDLNEKLYDDGSYRGEIY